MVSANDSYRVLVSHMGSPPHVRNSVAALYQAGMLARFATTFVDHPDSKLASAIKAVVGRLSPSLTKRFEQRSAPDIPFDLIRTRPALEVLRTVSERLLQRPRIADWIWEREEHDLDRWVSGMLGPHLDAVYVYEHGGLATLLRARARGVVSFCEFPSAHHSHFGKVYDREVRAYPELRQTEVSAIHEGANMARRNARKDHEAAVADCVLCNSTFTKRTLVESGVSGEKIEVVPLGCPRPAPKPQRVPDRVVFLNAGAQSLGKGAHVLYAAWRRLGLSENDGELRLYGESRVPDSFLSGLPGRVHLRGHVSHSELLDQYRSASVFVTASLGDGFAMVVAEAMSRGLPVIVTDATGAADLVEHGVNGFVVPAGDEQALAKQMQWCVDHKDRLPAMGTAAVETAGGWQWGEYRAALASTVERRIGRHSRRPPPSKVAA